VFTAISSFKEFVTVLTRQVYEKISKEKGIKKNGKSMAELV